MITIIHGDDIVSSRKEFISQREKNPQSLVLDGQNITIADLIQNLEGSLFGGGKTVFIESLLGRRGEEQKQILDYLKKQKTQDFVLWEGKELDKKTQMLFPGSQIQVYSFPKILFSFLEQIAPGRGKILIPTFHKLLEQMEAELVFFMIVRQFRLLLGVLDSKGVQIDEIKRLASWQKERVTRQASLFSYEQLKLVYNQLCEMDLVTKTGKTSLTLVQNIDIFLLDL